MLTVAPSPTFDALSMDPSTSTPNQHSLPSRSPAPKPLHLVAHDLASNSGPATAPLVSAPAHYDSLPSPISPARKTSRRQSSISYLPNVRDQDRSSWPASPYPSLARSQSARVGSKGDRRSTGSLEPRAQVDRGPLTLVEKHADLLHFIAQKESKCLELRSQLAREEEELLALKHKWEKIVNRGLQRSSAAASNGLVQGVGRMIAAGLSDLSSPTPPPSAVPKSLRRTSGYGHANNESTSSASTATTRTSSSTNRLSQSSVSSFEDTIEEQEEDRTVTHSHRSSKTFRRRSKDWPTPSPSPLSPSYTTPTASKRLSQRSALPPPSSPGLALLVGKWDQTLSKGSRRASALLSDVFAALGSPVPESPVPRHRGMETRSLLDDDEDDGRAMGGVMMPDSKPAPKPSHTILSPTPAKTATASVTNDDDDEWNW
ncbi:hypothetical protein NEOLEDRAFT_1180649 [Neolentinus lepideus HHB14362 ss-1]|uniref:Uncharacterized protein n=1 Tax=Neolentinus lepideus HHB14362 ss-1 TaxID=1314782 RepID=A0A165QQG2_9AGAM|nr:hypothetical protein NEOLEDRAFT_1180649 [Neolentinus lepideus HHB14362 ss-1]